MKKLVALLAGLLGLMLIAFCGCSSVKIPERPEDTNLEFWIAEDVSGVDWPNRHKIPQYGVASFLGNGYEFVIDEETGDEIFPEFYVRYIVSAWPDYADGGEYITQIIITDPQITVYGLTVNSTFEEFDNVFEGKNYTIKRNDKYTPNPEHQASIEGFIFWLREIHGQRQLIITANVENRDGPIYI